MVDEELDEIGQLVDPGTRHGIPGGRAGADPVHQRVVVAVGQLVSLPLQASAEEGYVGADAEVGASVADEEMGREISRRPPLAQGRGVRTEPLQLVTQLLAFGPGMARHEPHPLSPRISGTKPGGRHGLPRPRVEG